ncbi:MAG: low-specificity L-threonine aldolase [Nitrospinota bacterium]
MKEGRFIDLRSDTVTNPSQAMRESMAKAPVGDDCFGEDPSVNALQEEAARLLGKERALFVASGTMANQVALKSHTQPGDEVIVHAGSHLITSELAAGSMISGVQFAFLECERGIMEVEAVRRAIRAGRAVEPRTRLIWVENTHNKGGGSVWPLERLKGLRELALEAGLPLHMDGARIFNAAVALGVPVREIASYVDTVSFCLSKGLGAPVGSLLAGSREFIERATRYRRMLGGGMRQAGIVAAGGLFALKHHLKRIEKDHENARLLAEGLKETPGVRLLYETTPTNIVFFDVSETGLSAPELAARLKERGILFSVYPPNIMRAVTHLDVERQQIEEALGTMQALLKEARARA